MIKLALLVLLLTACSSNDVLLKKGDRFSISVEDAKSPLVSFSIPDGVWGVRKITLKTMTEGWFDINGQPGNSSPFGYAVQFSIAPAEKYGMNVIDVLKSQDFVAFANAVEPASSPKMLAEMQATNYGQKLIRVGSYNCKNSWYQQILAPQLNGGRGIPIFRNFIECPLVIDGRVFVFAISTNSGIRPAFIQWQAEQNKDKAPNEQITIDTKDHLSHLGDKVLAIFGTIQFHGKVSQNYADIANPELLQKKIDDQVPYQPRELKR